MLTETVFAWPGLGLYITTPLFNADMNAVLGGTLLVGAVFIGINLLSDLLYQLVDPRAEDIDDATPAGLAAERRARLATPGALRPLLSAAGCASRRNPLAMVGLVHRRCCWC